MGLLVHNSLRPSLQCSKAVKKANSVLGQLCRGVGFRDKKVFIDLYVTYVRPHLEYAVQAWSPWTLGDMDMLESVQRRAVKAVSNLKTGTYFDRLEEVGLSTLQERRIRGDLLQVYRVLTGKDSVSSAAWFTMCQTEGDMVTTRQGGGHLNIVPLDWNTELRRKFWSVRVVNLWNSLPDSIKKAESLNSFKNSLDNWTEGEKKKG